MAGENEKRHERLMRMVKLCLAAYPGYLEKFQLDMELDQSLRFPVRFEERTETQDYQDRLTARALGTPYPRPLVIDTAAEGRATVEIVGRWLEAKREDERKRANALSSIQNSVVPTQRHRLRTEEREQRILDSLISHGYDPKALPKRSSGKSGVKAKIKGALSKDSLLVGSTVFNKAWTSLRSDGRICEAA